MPPPPPPGSGFPPPPRPAAQPGPAAYGAPGAIPAYGAAAPAAPAGFQPAMSPALAAQAMRMPAMRPRPGRGFLRFFAVSCISTAWLSLVLCVILGIMSFGAGGTLKAYFGALSSLAPGTSMGDAGTFGTDPSLGDPYGSSPQMSPGAGGLGAQGLGAMAGPLIDRVAWLFWLGGFLNILSGVCFWIFFVGLGKLTYGFLDLEEQAARDHDAVQILLASSQR